MKKTNISMFAGRNFGRRKSGRMRKKMKNRHLELRQKVDMQKSAKLKVWGVSGRPGNV